MWQNYYKKALQLSGKIGPVFILFLVIAIFGSMKPETFFSFQNISNVIGQTVVVATAAIGMTFIIVSAGIDLSVGSIIALAGVYATMFMTGHSGLMYVAIALLIGLITGAVCGLVNGIMITKGRLAPFIVTLGMMEIVRGIALQSTGGMPISNLPGQFGYIGNGVYEITLSRHLDFAPDEIKNYKALANRFRSTDDSVAAFLRQSLTPDTVQKLDSWNPSTDVPEPLQSSIRNDLNKILRGGLIYAQDRFAKVSLSPDVIKRIEAKPQGDNLVHLNRKLLEEAYPSFIAKGDTLLFLPYSLWILLPLGLIAAFVLRYTVFGIQVYAVGSNEKTAQLCGVNVNRVKTLVYMIGGFTCGIAGILHSSRMNTGQPTEAAGKELEVIAAVVIGGGSLMGGEGTILGSIIGAFIIMFLRNGCNVVGVSPFVQRIVIGLIIIIAVYVDQLRRRTLTEKS